MPDVYLGGPRFESPLSSGLKTLNWAPWAKVFEKEYSFYQKIRKTPVHLLIQGKSGKDCCPFVEAGYGGQKKRSEC